MKNWRIYLLAALFFIPIAFNYSVPKVQAGTIQVCKVCGSNIKNYPDQVFWYDYDTINKVVTSKNSFVNQSTCPDGQNVDKIGITINTTVDPDVGACKTPTGNTGGTSQSKLLLKYTDKSGTTQSVTFNSDQQTQCQQQAASLISIGATILQSCTVSDGSGGGGSISDGSGGGGTVSSKLPNPLSFDSICALVNFLVNLITEVGAVVGVLFIIWAGFLFIYAQGNPQKLKLAKSTLITTLVGIAILLGSSVLTKIIVGTVASVLGISSSSCTF